MQADCFIEKNASGEIKKNYGKRTLFHPLPFLILLYVDVQVAQNIWGNIFAT